MDWARGTRGTCCKTRLKARGRRKSEGWWTNLVQEVSSVAVCADMTLQEESMRRSMPQRSLPRSQLGTS